MKIGAHPQPKCGLNIDQIKIYTTRGIVKYKYKIRCSYMEQIKRKLILLKTDVPSTF